MMEEMINKILIYIAKILVGVLIGGVSIILLKEIDIKEFSKGMIVSTCIWIYWILISQIK